MSLEKFIFGLSIILFVVAVLIVSVRITKRVRGQKIEVLTDGILEMLAMGIVGIVSHVAVLSMF